MNVLKPLRLLQWLAGPSGLPLSHTPTSIGYFLTVNTENVAPILNKNPNFLFRYIKDNPGLLGKKNQDHVKRNQIDIRFCQSSFFCRRNRSHTYLLPPHPRDLDNFFFQCRCSQNTLVHRSSGATGEPPARVLGRSQVIVSLFITVTWHG